MPDRTQAPQIKDAIDFQYILPDIQSFNCTNNIPVYTYLGGSQPVIQIEWVFEAGLWYEPRTSVAHAVAALLKSGTRVQSELEINEALEYYGASFKVSVNNDYATLTLHCLTKHLPFLLPVIFDIITIPSFPVQELDIYKQNAIQALQVRLLNCDFVANRHIEAHLFGSAHPYGRYAELADIEALTRDDLVDFYISHFRADRCRIFVAGLYTEEDIRLISALFGSDDWNAADVEVPEPNFHKYPAGDRIFRYINNEQGVQAAIRLARDFVPRDHADFLPMQILNTVFGGYFGSRLMTNIREEKGYTYGIYSYVAAYRHESMIMITSEVGKDVAQPSLDEVAAEMKKLREQPIDHQELLLVKNYVLGGLLGDLDGPFSIMRMWKMLILNGEHKEAFDERVRVFQSVDAVTLQELAQKYLKAEDFYQVVVV